MQYLGHAAAAKSLQSCPTLCKPIRRQPTRLPVPGILQARTWVGCHFLLQCMRVKSESEVAQSCPTLRDPMDCSLPVSSIHGIFKARVLEWGAIAFYLGHTYTKKGLPDSSIGKESACNAGDPSPIPGTGRCAGEGTGYPLQYSDLENSMDCVVHGVINSQTWLSDFH